MFRDIIEVVMLKGLQHKMYISSSIKLDILEILSE